MKFHLTLFNGFVLMYIMNVAFLFKNFSSLFRYHVWEILLIEIQWKFADQHCIVENVLL